MFVVLFVVAAGVAMMLIIIPLCNVYYIIVFFSTESILILMGWNGMHVLIFTRICSPTNGHYYLESTSSSSSPRCATR